jgi:Concanavalin A-like lectin/glucanases superfamily/FG-GAP-like repeat/HYR domain
MKNAMEQSRQGLRVSLCLVLAAVGWAATAGLPGARASDSAPTIFCPSNIQVTNAPGQCGAEVSFDPTANGAPPPSIQCRTNGAAISTMHFFPVGTNTVVCTAGNGVLPEAMCSFTITVKDVEPPTIYSPSLPTTVEDVPGGGSAVVDFKATAYDNCAVVSTNCTPPSGSMFMVGTTPVTCVATDSSGNTNAVTFDVVVCPVTNVVTSLANSGPGSLHEAIELSNDCPGTNYIVFGVTGTIVLTNALPGVSDPLFILGPGPASLTVARGSDPQLDCFGIFYLNEFDIAWISGLTISNGCDSAGGGVYNTGNGVLSNCVVTGNTAFGGEGGAGIYNESDLLIVDCSIVGNTATNNARGGGIYTVGNLLVVINSLITDNSSQREGGGLYVTSSDAALTNVTFSGNNSATNGGGIYLSSFGDFVAASVTIASNTAAAAGGGIYDDDNDEGELKNTIVAGNTASSGPDVEGMLVSLGHNLIGDGSGSSGFVDGTMGDQVGTSGSPINPLLGPLQNNGGPTLTHALPPGSPALNSGTNDLAPLTDQRGAGFARINAGTIDIGAYEAPCASPLVNMLADQRVCYGSPVTFSVTVTSALPYTVQWCEGDFPIHNATNNTLTVTAEYDMNYSVKVQNACGSVTNRAQLLVDYADLYGPDDLVICPGETAAFLVEVYATVPFTLEWCKNGVPLPGETNVLLILSNTTPASAGVYSVKLTSQCGMFTNSAVLEFTNPPPGTLVFLPGGVGLPDVKRGAVRWGDYDKDGLLDLLVIGEDSSGEHVFHNNGNGTFSGSGAVIDDLIYCDAAWADFDKDGFLDFVISGQQGFGPSPTVTKVYQNLSGTNFVEIMASLPGARSGSVVWGDANNDTFPDLLIAGIEEPSGTIFTALYLNDTMGNFTNSGAALPGIIFGKASFADYDQDGFLDILVTGADDSFNEFTKLLRNNQSGQFIDSGIALKQLRDSSAAWGDCNNDNFPDLLLLGWDTSLPGFPRYSILYTNDGSGGLVDSMAGLPGVAFGAAAWGDYDGDGFQDFALSGSGENDIFTRIFRNTGNCQFVDGGIDLVPVEDSSLDWGDFDNDGDLDLILAGGADLGGEGTDNLTILYRNCQPRCDLTARLDALPPTNCIVTPLSLQLSNPACVVFASNQPISYLKATLTNIPPGFYVTNGMYRAWCVEYAGSIEVGPTYKPILYLSHDILPPHLQNTKWDIVNYILNHKQGNGIDVQNAIWHFMGGPVPASDRTYFPPSATASNLIADALANGPGFVPAPGEVSAVILDLGRNVQRIVIEARCPGLLDRCPGDFATFCTVASGTGPFSYSWFKDGVLIPGQSNRCLTVGPLKSSDTGSYGVNVSTRTCSVSNGINLVVHTNVVVPPLGNVVACAGSTAMIAANATGSGPLHYVWRRGNSILAGQTGAVLVLPSVKQSDAGSYSVEVSGRCSVTTSSGQLIVSTPVSATGPASLTRIVGESASFSVTPVGGPALAFQWTRAGTNLPGATNATLVLGGLSTNDSGIYCAIVQGACNRVTNCAVLNVVPVAPVELGCAISQWNFDEPMGSIALDTAGPNPGALINDPTRVAGKFGSALQFNGVNQIVNVPNSASLNVPQRFSISLWFRPGQNLNAASGRKDLFKKFLSYWLILNYPANDGKISFVLNSGGYVVRSTTSSWNSNQWYHIVATHDGATMKLYINGALEGSSVVGISAAASTYPVQIGGNTEQGHWFPGAMDDVRLFCTNLAANAVQALFNGTNGTPPPPPPVNTPPVISDLPSRTIAANSNTGDIPFTIGDAETPVPGLLVSATSSNTTLVPVGNITLDGSGSNRTVRVTPAANLTGTSLITITVSDGVLTTNDTFLVTVTNVPPPPPGSSTNLLISHWKLDEVSGNTALDSTGPNQGTLMGGALREPAGKFGGAALFDGNNDHVNMPDSPSLDLSNRFSISLWFRPSQLLHAGSGRKDLLQKFLSYWIILNYPNGDGRLSFVLNSGSPYARSTTTIWQSNTWYHVAATYDGVTMKLYINGVLEDSTSSVFLPNNTASPLQIGGNTTQGHWFPGAIDDVRLYGNPLAADAITALHGGLSPLLPPGGVITASPTLRIHNEPENDLVVLRWPAQSGRSYRVEYTDDLATGEWTPLPGEATVTGSTARAEDTLGLSVQRFYRVVVER